jgi:hypothetical protein
MEEVVALGADRLLEVGARDEDGDQRQVVVAVDLHVQLAARRRLAIRRRLGQLPAQSAQLDRLGDDLMVPRRGVDAAAPAVVQLQVKERRRLAPAPSLGGVVADRLRDPAEEEAGLVGAELDVRLLAVGVSGRGLAVHPGQSALSGPLHQPALGAGEEVLPAGGRQRHRLPGVGDRVIRCPEAHPDVAKQLACRAFGDAGDVGAGSDPPFYLQWVVHPPYVITLTICRLDRARKHGTLV